MSPPPPPSLEALPGDRYAQPRAARSAADMRLSHTASSGATSKSKLRGWMNTLGSKFKSHKPPTALARPSEQQPVTAKPPNVSARDLSANMAAATASGGERLDSFLYHLEEIEERALALAQQSPPADASRDNRLFKQKGSSKHAKPDTDSAALAEHVMLNPKTKEAKSRGSSSSASSTALPLTRASDSLFVESPSLGRAQSTGRSNLYVLSSVSALGLQCSILERYLGIDSCRSESKVKQEGCNEPEEVRLDSESLAMEDIAVTDSPRAVSTSTAPVVLA